VKTTQHFRALPILGFLTLGLLMAQGRSQAASVAPVARVTSDPGNGVPGSLPSSRAASHRQPIGDGEREVYSRRESASHDLERFAGGREVDIFIGGGCLIALVAFLILIVLLS